MTIEAVAVEDDCDQGFALLSDGCRQWPCDRVPLEKVRRGGAVWWCCPKCGASYGEAV